MRQYFWSILKLDYESDNAEEEVRKLRRKQKRVSLDDNASIVAVTENEEGQ